MELWRYTRRMSGTREIKWSSDGQKVSVTGTEVAEMPSRTHLPLTLTLKSTKLQTIKAKRFFFTVCPEGSIMMCMEQIFNKCLKNYIDSNSIMILYSQFLIYKSLKSIYIYTLTFTEADHFSPNVWEPCFNIPLPKVVCIASHHLQSFLKVNGRKHSGFADSLCIIVKKEWQKVILEWVWEK